MSRACPVLGSTAGGIPELIAPDCLHQPGNVKQLTQQLVEAAGNDEWRRVQAKANFNRAHQYTKEKLDQRRREFWLSFRDYVRANSEQPDYIPEGAEAL